jgi:hypothetical protein
MTAMSRDEIIPTYRVPTLGRAPGDQVDQSGVEPPTSPVRGTMSHTCSSTQQPQVATRRAHLRL